jgi:hypothetical protein
MTMQENMLKIYGASGKLILKAPLLKNETFKINIQVQGEQQCLSAVADSWL